MENPIKAIKEYLAQYLNLRTQEFKLEALERLVNVMGYFIISSIVFFFAILTFSFAAIGFAIWLGDALESRVGGYLTVSGIVLLLLILVIIFKKSIFKFIGGKILWILTKPKEQKTIGEEAETSSPSNQ